MPQGVFEIGDRGFISGDVGLLLIDFGLLVDDVGARQILLQLLHGIVGIEAQLQFAHFALEDIELSLVASELRAGYARNGRATIALLARGSASCRGGSRRSAG